MNAKRSTLYNAHPMSPGFLIYDTIPLALGEMAGERVTGHARIAL